MGTLLFFIPVVAVVALVFFGLLSFVSSESGTLIVEARAYFAGNASFLSAQATVSGTARATPFNVSLSAGTYIVTYSQESWYHTPSPVTVTVLGARTAYAIGTYTPVEEGVTITAGGPNSSRIEAEHGVTPVVIINNSGRTIQLVSSLFVEYVPAGGNYTQVFTTAGSFLIEIPQPAGSFTIDVK